MSERMIAEQLVKFGLPYKYDTVLNLNYSTVSPDFVIINPFNGQTFVWEQFGAFHDLKYTDQMNDKMDAYLQQGYIEGVHLITTFEYHLRNLERVRALIRQVIL